MWCGYLLGAFVVQSLELFSTCLIFFLSHEIFSARTNFLLEIKSLYNLTITCNMWQNCKTLIKVLPGSHGKLQGENPHHKSSAIGRYGTVPCYLENLRVEIRSVFSNRLLTALVLQNSSSSKNWAILNMSVSVTFCCYKSRLQFWLCMYWKQSL